MAVIYPENWQTLRNAHTRSELLFNLQELADREYQQQSWIDRSIDTHLIVGIDQIFHFFFDDTDLAENALSEIGFILFDEREAGAVRNVTLLLARMLTELGDADDAAFLRHGLWPNLLQEAQKAHLILKEQGVPEFS
jgi:hypothetical protein